MIFHFENELYKYELSFEDTDNGPYLIVWTFDLTREGYSGSSSTGLPIKNGKIVWLPNNVAALHLTAEAMKYADCLMQLRVFW